MSTKIYYGLRCVDRDLWVARKRINEVLRKVFEDKVEESLQFCKDNRTRPAAVALENTWTQEHDLVEQTVNNLSKYTNKELDLWVAGDDEKFPRYAVLDELFALMEALKKFPTITTCQYDFGYEITFLENRAGKQALVMVFSDDIDYYDALLASGAVEEYGYWDNTDRPENVTAAQWRTRKKAWSSLIEGTPAEMGLTMDQPSLNSYLAQCALRDWYRMEPKE